MAFEPSDAGKFSRPASLSMAMALIMAAVPASFGQCSQKPSDQQIACVDNELKNVVRSPALRDYVKAGELKGAVERSGALNDYVKADRLEDYVKNEELKKNLKNYVSSGDLTNAIRAIMRTLGDKGDRFWVVLAALLVFFMAAGFLFLELGMLPGSYDGLQSIQKLWAWAMTYILYFPIGFGLMFAVSILGGFWGTPGFPEDIIRGANRAIDAAAGSIAPLNVRGIGFFLFEAAFAGTAVTIPAGATACRIGLRGFLVCAMFIAGLAYPVFGHWAWGGGIYSQEALNAIESKAPHSAPGTASDNGKRDASAAESNSSGLTPASKESDQRAPELSPFQRENPQILDRLKEKNSRGWLQQHGFHDFAGSTVVHSVGGWFGLIGALFLGPRRGRFIDGRVNVKGFRGRSLGMSIGGALFLWFGWYGFNGGSKLLYASEIDGIILYTNIAAVAALGSASVIAVIEDHWQFAKRWKGFVPEKSIGGLLGGLVAITASCDIVEHWWQAAIVGTVAGLIHNVAFDLLLALQIDDPVGAVPVHAACGVWGTLFVTWLPGGSFGIQFAGVLAALAWTVLVAIVCFGLLNWFGWLRMDEVARLRWTTLRAGAT